MLDDRSNFTRYRRQNFIGGLGLESPILRAYQEAQNCTRGEVLTVEDTGGNTFNKCTVSFRGQTIGATCAHPDIEVGMAVAIVERPLGRYWATLLQNSWYARPLREVAQKGKPVTAAVEWLLSRGSKWRPDLILLDKSWNPAFDPDDPGDEEPSGSSSIRDTFDYFDSTGTGITYAQWIAGGLPGCLFASFDANSDGVVSFDEWRVLQPAELVTHGGTTCYVQAPTSFGGLTTGWYTFAEKLPAGYLEVSDDGTGGTGTGAYHYKYVSRTTTRITGVLYFNPCPSGSALFFVPYHFPH
jgi:hypothetical protein